MDEGCVVFYRTHLTKGSAFVAVVEVAHPQKISCYVTLIAVTLETGAARCHHCKNKDTCFR